MRFSPRAPLACSIIAAVSISVGVTNPARAASQPANTQSAQSAPTDFYHPPATFPEAPGSLIKTAPGKLALSLPGLNGKRLPATPTQVMFTTTDSSGKAVPTTGLYLEPIKPWKIAGETPLAVFAAGTLGQADRCAPSYATQEGLDVSLQGVSLGYELPQVYQLLLQGIAVIIPDYIGQGNPNITATYVNRLDIGRVVNDGARVASRVPGATVTKNSPVVYTGFSLGGGASGSAAEMHSTYAPEINLKGVQVTSPAADLKIILDGLDRDIIAGAQGYAVNGALQSYPELQPVFDKYLTDYGRRDLAKIANQCLTETIVTNRFGTSREWFKGRLSVQDIAGREPLVAKWLSDQRLGTIKPEVPVRVSTGILDGTWPHRQSRQVAVDWCALGATVEYKPVITLPTPSPLALNHLLTPYADTFANIAFIRNSLEGKTPVNSCATIETRL